MRAINTAVAAALSLAAGMVGPAYSLRERAEPKLETRPRFKKLGRPALFRSPKHFERHGKSLTAEKAKKAAARYGVRPGRSNLRRSERKAAP